MITNVTGKLVKLTDVEATLELGPFQVGVLVPEFVRRRLQKSFDEEISLKTIAYLDGNPQKGRLTPRLVGFLTEAEREFFDLVCSVDGVGVKKALRAIVRPVGEVASEIEEQDVKKLSTLPGIGPAVAERIVAKLRRKMAKFALMIEQDLPEDLTVKDNVANETYEALLAVGHTQVDARQRIEEVLETGKKFKTVEALLGAIYQNRRDAGL